MSQKYYDDQYNYNQPPPQHSQGHGYNQGQYPPTMPQAPNYQPQQQYDNTFYPNMGSNPQQNQNQNPNQYLYQQQDYGYPPPPIPTGHALQGQSGSEKFVRTSRFRDLWAAILFLSLFAAHIVFAIIASGGNTKNNLFGLKTGKLGVGFFAGLCLGAFVISILISLLFMVFTYKMPRTMLTMAFWFTVCLFTATGIYSIITKNYIPGVLLLVVVALYALSWKGYKSRIPFSSIILDIVIKVVKKFPSSVVLSLLWSILGLAYNLFFIYALSSIYLYLEKYQSCSPSRDAKGRPTQTCTNVPLYITIALYIFMYYWTIQVIFNVLHTTICGLYATYFFFDGTPEGYPSKFPLLSALKRASVFSFGSICFGSLMVALIQTIRALLRNAMHSDDNNIVAVILFVCIDCILGCIESLLEMFNRYAYIEIAIYGKPFVQAAKDTLHLVKSKGIDALVNDILINNLVIMGSLVTGLVCGVLSYVAILIFESSAKSNTGFVVATIAAGFVVGFSIFLIIYGVLESGSSTVFVCLCEDPYSLARTKPELFNAIASTYPDVVQGLYTH